MDFKTILETLPTIDHLAGLSVFDGETQIHHIPAIAGKLGSLRVYNALAQEFNGKLDRTCAEKGLQLFAEHTQDAKQFPGKHPNIDLLFDVIEQGKDYRLVPEEK
ncbi:DUF2322 domain-containing protein [Avibacterium gallinarum]|uniref:Uncharacterized protein conserved in bacteria n=1 Tax=Avibacterium gallinarum TaxID=755 RepID=A0A379AZG4_AVIGA|nr:DUF2322 family protein [Avibacterium gallinarum]POY44343.1 DUF2322 domain-containing protein [Avibacterium gallinarum]TDP28074.1 hypothetical protein EV689_10720 [Avibacterium gallinarum]SUB28046.1 Uncharacterized protein conserved in bacteria [Avibacterium gallinarum]